MICLVEPSNGGNFKPFTSLLMHMSSEVPEKRAVAIRARETLPEGETLNFR